MKNLILNTFHQNNLFNRKAYLRLIVAGSFSFIAAIMTIITMSQVYDFVNILTGASTHDPLIFKDLSQASRAVILLCLICLNTILQILTVKLCFKLSWRSATDISNAILNKSTNITWNQLCGIGKNRLSTALISDNDVLARQYFVSNYDLLTASLTIMSIICFLLSAINLEILAILAFSLGLYALIQMLLQRYSILLGNQLKHLRRQRVNSVTELYSGWLEISNLTRKHQEVGQIQQRFDDFANAQSSYDFLIRLPTHLLRGLIYIVFISIIIIYQRIPNNDMSLLAGQLVLLLFAATRLIPDISKFFKSILQLRNFKPTKQAYLELLNIDELKRNKNSSRDWSQIDINIKQVILPDLLTPSKRRFELKLKKGDKVCINGSSGVGKSVVLTILAGLNDQFMGEIKVDGKKVEDLGCVQHDIYYSPQDSLIYDGSVYRNLTMGSTREYPNSVLEAYLKTFQLFNEIPGETLEDKLNFQISSQGRNLSGGQIQRISIIRALLSDKEIVIFDEPNSALDPQNSEIILSEILKSTKTIILTLHGSSDTQKFQNKINLKYG